MSAVCERLRACLWGERWSRASALRASVGVPSRDVVLDCAPGVPPPRLPYRGDGCRRARTIRDISGSNYRVQIFRKRRLGRKEVGRATRSRVVGRSGRSHPEGPPPPPGRLRRGPRATSPAGRRALCEKGFTFATHPSSRPAREPRVRDNEGSGGGARRRRLESREPDATRVTEGQSRVSRTRDLGESRGPDPAPSRSRASGTLSRGHGGRIHARHRRDRSSWKPPDNPGSVGDRL